MTRVAGMIHFERKAGINLSRYCTMQDQKPRRCQPTSVARCPLAESFTAKSQISKAHHEGSHERKQLVKTCLAFTALKAAAAAAAAAAASAAAVAVAAATQRTILHINDALCIPRKWCRVPWLF
jgi:hypothetical protein